MKYSIKHTTWYAYTEPVPVCHNLLHLLPRSTPLQTCQAYRLTISPKPVTVTECVDYFGNHVDYFSLHQAHRKLSITAESIVEVTSPADRSKTESPAWESVVKEIAADRSPHGLKVRQLVDPSPRVLASRELCDYAQVSFTAGRPILAAMEDLRQRIYADFAFDSKATTVNTPLAELLKLRRGVCQDFAHLAIGCLRSMGLAARYVSGYLRTMPPPGSPRLVGADASHAWASVFAGQLGWIDLDPTNNVFANDSHISIGWGRDYDDVCPVQGVFIGGGDHRMGISVDVTPVDAAADVESPAGPAC